MALQGGGGSSVMRRDIGTAGTVQNQIASGSALYGANLAASLPTTVFQQAGGGGAQLSQIVAGAKKFWIKISGVWKEAVTWIKIAGVWKQATPNIKIGGIWK